MLASISVTISSILMMFALVSYNINDLVGQFAELNDEHHKKSMVTLLKNSEETRENVSDYFMKQLLNKARNLLSRDNPVLLEHFRDNSIGLIGRFLQNAFELDDEIIQASFMILEDGETSLWYFVNDQYKDGIPLGRNSYDKEAGSWQLKVGDEEIIIEDPYAYEILSSDQLKTVLRSYTDAKSGELKKFLDISTPIFDGKADDFEELKAEGAPIAFLRYQLSFDKVNTLIQMEEKKLDNVIKEQEAQSQKLVANAQAIGKKARSSSMIFIGASGILILIAGGIFTNVIAKHIIRPIQSLRESTEKIAEGNYTQEVKACSEDEVGVLAKNFERMRLKVKAFTDDLQGLVDERTKELRAAVEEAEYQRQKVAEILEKIEQGIVTFDANLKILPQYSSFLERFYKKKPEEIVGHNIFDILLPQHNLSADVMNMVQEILKVSIGNDSINWIANLRHLPKEVAIKLDGKFKILALDWTPIERNGITERVMLSVRDLTDQKMLEKLSEQVNEQNQLMIELFAHYLHGNKAKIDQFVKSMQKEMLEFRSMLQSSDVLLKNVNTLLHKLHTIKGNARTLKLSKLANEVHEAESFGKLLLESSEPSGSVTEGLYGQLKAIDQIITLYDEVISSTMDQLPEQKLHEYSLLQLVLHYMNEVSEYASGHGFVITSVECHDEIKAWHKNCLPYMREFLLHALNNAIDHGFVIPKANDIKVDKSVFLKIESRKEGEFAVITIADNGVGLNEARATELANKIGFVPGKDQTLYDVLFLDGISTVENVSQRSGRGVGLAAVKNIADHFGGRAYIENLESGGTRLILKVPLNSVYYENANSVVEIAS